MTNEYAPNARPALRYYGHVETPLTIVHALGSFGMGGAERIALDLAVLQQRLGHRVVALSLSADAGPLAPAFGAAGIYIRTVPKRPGIDFTLPPRVALMLREEGVTVLHTHNPIPLIYAAPAARTLGIPVVHTKHGEGHMGSRGEKLLRKLASPCANSFVTVSETTAEQARAQRDSLIASRITVIRNGIALDRFHPDASARKDARAELGIPEDAWVVGTVGRVDENKNHRALVSALSPVLASDLQLIIVGDGPAMGDLRAACAALPQPGLVHLLGRRLDTPRLMAAFDVFALPSLSEGLPLVIPEAMACGLPVVSSAVGGIPNVVIEGETGHLVPPGDEEALREKILGLRLNRAQAAAMGLAGRERALQEYSAERMAREYIELYRRALRRSPRRSRA